jgi:hypothetical protein
MLRTLAAQGERYMDAGELARALGKKPTGGHWNSGIAILRNNGLLIEAETPRSKRYRAAALFGISTDRRPEIASSGSHRPPVSQRGSCASPTRKGPARVTSHRPHFLDGHRRSRLYRAAIINPHRLAVKLFPKSADFLVQILRREREAEPLAGAPRRCGPGVADQQLLFRVLVAATRSRGRLG